MELLHLSADMDYSETCFRSDEHRSRFCIEGLQQQNGVDSEQESIPDDNLVLNPRGGSICSSNQQPATTLCCKIPTVSSDRCFSPALGTVDGVHTCSNSAFSTDSAESTTGLVIAPTWPGQPWFPVLLELLVGFPAQLPIAEGTIFLPFEQQAIHPVDGFQLGSLPLVSRFMKGIFQL